MMPDLGGVRVLEEIRDDPELADTPIIVVTGKVDAVPGLRDLLGEDRVFVKPFAVAELLATRRRRSPAGRCPRGHDHQRCRAALPRRRRPDAAGAGARSSTSPRGSSSSGTTDRKPLAGKAVAVVFEKPSTRTRLSFEVGIAELGAHPVILDAQSTQLGRGETIEDTARVLSRYVSAIVIRTFGDDRIQALAAASSVPVVNALTDGYHPCQILADLQTIRERKGAHRGPGADLPRRRRQQHGQQLPASAAPWPAWTCASARPPATSPTRPSSSGRAAYGTDIVVTDDAKAAAEGADVLCTDVWVSMGMTGAEQRLSDLAAYAARRGRARPGRPAMRSSCTACRRTAARRSPPPVIDGPQSAVWDEAENRLHAQKALLTWLLERSGTAARWPSATAAGRPAGAPDEGGPSGRHRRAAGDPGRREPDRAGPAARRARASRSRRRPSAATSRSSGPARSAPRRAPPTPCRPRASPASAPTRPSTPGSPGCSRSSASAPRPPARSSCCARRPGARTCSVRRSTAPACPRSPAPSPATTPSCSSPAHPRPRPRTPSPPGCCGWPRAASN